VSQVARSDLQTIWSEVRQALGDALPRSLLDLWFERVRPLDLRAGTLTVAVPPGDRAWIERRYGSLLDRVVRRVNEGINRVAIADAPIADTPESPAPLAPNPLHTFDRFVIGPGNRLAHAASLATAELPGEAYNPLFLHGPPGLGKTHLLGAIAGYLAEHRPELTVHYTTAERFTTEFVTCLRQAGPEGFKRRYRSLDALLIDDVQALEGKRRTEEEFVDTFNALHRESKQIVLSSDRPPEALQALAERLRDRFHWGLTVEIHPPDLRTRLTLLWRIASSLPLDLREPGALSEIASSVPDNVRRLEGAMTRVAARASLFSEPISHKLVASALEERRGTSPRRDPSAPDLVAIQAAVASATGVSLAELTSKSRSPRVARARQLAMYLTSEITGASIAEIARKFERDHTTVLHALRAVAGRLEPGSLTLDALHHAQRDLGMAAPTTATATPSSVPHPRCPSTSTSRDDARVSGSNPPPPPAPIHLP
jgi:chromosomal replication initiator protein